jgi:flagellar M-ring protein FliF
MAGLNNASSRSRVLGQPDAGQKRFLLAGAAGTLRAGVVCQIHWLTRLQASVQTGLDPRAQKLTEQLDAQGIPIRSARTARQSACLRKSLPRRIWQTASLGPSQSGRTGFELFDKMSWGQTEFDQKVTYQRALEGELERTIATLNDVESARVHLVMPSDSVFLDRQHTAKASVILKLRATVYPRMRYSLSRDWYPERWIS